MGGETTIRVADMKTGSQLPSPRCSVQSDIKRFLHNKSSGEISDMSVGTKNMVGKQDIRQETEYTMVVEDISHSNTKDISISVPSTTPSVEKHHEPAALELMEEVRGEEDILKPTNELETDDCVLNKKQLRCEKHDCVIKVLSVSNQKWQWIEKKKQYGYVTKQARIVHSFVG